MATIASLLDQSRNSLLDLSTRNRLISIPQNSKQAKIIEVVDELSTEIFRLLVKEAKPMSFLPGKNKSKNTVEEVDATTQEDKDDDFGELPQPDENESIDERGVAKRHSDLYLQTLLTSEGLQKKLLSLFYDATTFEEEQGVNILYLAVGMLKWFEDKNSKIERYAPLILIPVSLQRGGANEKFKIKWRSEEPAANLSLQAKMKAEFGIIIPDLPDDDDFDIESYFVNVNNAISAQERFTVEQNKMVLGFFSFAKFLMYRDLDPANWPSGFKIDNSKLIKGLLQDGFSTPKDLFEEDIHIDEHIYSARIFHVVDADSSQTLAIEEVRRGRDIVIQGPPGTGKSQTITNIIASAIADGKKVLFVAEKMAALEVVQRRMSNIGLGPLCLELHSSKSNKRAVLEELKNTKDLGRPITDNNTRNNIKLDELKHELNSHAKSLHIIHQPSLLTPYNIIGNLVKLKQYNHGLPKVKLLNCQNWSPEVKTAKRDLLMDLADRINQIGIPAKSIWRGVDRMQLLPSETDTFRELLDELQKSFAIILKLIQQTEIEFNLSGKTIGDFKNIKAISSVFKTLPDLDSTTLSSQYWQNDISFVYEIVRNGKYLEELKENLTGIVLDNAYNIDLYPIRDALVKHGGSIFRIFNSSYKSAVKQLESIVSQPLLKDNKYRIELIDKIIHAQKNADSLKVNQQISRECFGKNWLGEHSDWKSLFDIIAWVKGLRQNDLPNDFLTSCSHINDLKVTAINLDKIENAIAKTTDQIANLFQFLKCDVQRQFGVASINDIERHDLLTCINLWGNSMESITQWISFKMRYDKLEKEELLDFSNKLWTGEISYDRVIEIFEKAYYDYMIDLILKAYPDLLDFDGHNHDKVIQNFRESDNYDIERARLELRVSHYNSIPRVDGGIGPLGILNGEFAKKRNHLPIRKLLKKAGSAIQAIKPVFMMSPLSVAQFLEPGSMEFDLLVIDEASQVEPVDALGAIARTKQLVVVGDTRQLPPTRFFARMTGNVSDGESEEDDNVSTSDVESILGLCLAKGLPQRMLRWHYRSKHQSLIAVSNKEFYENKLFIVPSPYDASSGMGLNFIYINNGVFDSGGTSTNQIEAKAVAEAVIKHALECPELSLGIGTFSMKQKQAIIDELELLRRKYPDTETFFSGMHPNEPFFIKNLENIQGDERDVIFISVGYGKNSTGYMAMRFGPLSLDGGERRLNVLISRAKRKCMVFSSIKSEDIDLERAKGIGVASLKLFLRFAETGKLDYNKITDREADSIFEEQVADAIRAKGYDVKMQIGIAGFFIDLAVVHPEMPGRFVLGIECDGANYHSSRSARDRDRLRQAVLEDHGWIIHRIWSTDWFRRPQEQVEKVLEAISTAQKAIDSHKEKLTVNSPNKIFQVASVDEDDCKIGQRLSVFYQETVMAVPLHIEPHELSDGDMSKIVSKIIETESPIHENEVVTRVRTLWNLSRAGSRIHAKVKLGLNYAKEKGLIKIERDFYLHPNNKIIIRDRSISPGSIKKVEHLPPQEIAQAIINLIEVNFGAGREQLASEVARLLGFKSTSAQLREVIENEIQLLINNRTIYETENGLKKN